MKSLWRSSFFLGILFLPGFLLAGETKYGLDFGTSTILGGVSPLQGISLLSPPLSADIDNPPGFVSPTFSYIGGRARIGTGPKAPWVRLGFTLGYDHRSLSGDIEVQGVTATSTRSSGLFSLGLSPGIELPLIQAGRVGVSFVGFLPVGIGTLSLSSKEEATVNNQKITQESSVDYTAFWFGLSGGIGASIELLDGFYLGSEYRMIFFYSSLSSKDAPDLSEIGFVPISLNFLLSYRF